MIYPNPQNQVPQISKSAWIADTAIIIGNVTIGDNVFVAHNVIIRADEPGSSIVIGDNSNVQDKVIVHSISYSDVVIGNNTSLSHGCIVHGPCVLGDECFVGFGAVAFDCVLGDGSIVMHNATVRKVTIPSGKVVPDGMSITSPKAMECLEELSLELDSFKRSVVKANLDLVNGYRSLAMEV